MKKKQANKYIMTKAGRIQIEKTPIIEASNRPEAWAKAEAIAKELSLNYHFGVLRLKKG